MHSSTSTRFTRFARSIRCARFAPLLLAPLALSVASTGCASAQGERATTPAAIYVEAGPTRVRGPALESDTELVARLDGPLGLGVSQVGQPFTATVEQPVVDAFGAVVIPAGAKLCGTVTELHPAAPLTAEPSTVRLAVRRLEIAGVYYDFPADIDATQPHTSKLRPGLVVGGVLTGVALGGVLGKSSEAAVVGGMVGGSAGTLISLGMDREQARLPAGTSIAVSVIRPVPLTALRRRPVL